MVNVLKIIIIRHAEPDYSVDSLTEKGFKEVIHLTERLEGMNVKKIYCSPLGRAKATIEPFAKKAGKSIEILPWLREFPGKLFSNTEKENICWDIMPSFLGSKDKLSDCYEWEKEFPFNTGNAGEKYRYVVNELYNLLEELGYKKQESLFRVDNNNEDVIVFCCHFALGMVLISALTEIAPPLLWQGFFLAPSSISCISTEEREKGFVAFRCEYIGDTSHLYKNGEPVSRSGMYGEVFYDNKKHIGSKA